MSFVSHPLLPLALATKETRLAKKPRKSLEGSPELVNDLDTQIDVNSSRTKQETAVTRNKGRDAEEIEKKGIVRT